MTKYRIGGGIGITGFAGSLRAGSYNRALLREAQGLTPADLRLDNFTLDELSLYNDDQARREVPAAVNAFKDQIQAADGLLIAAAEYNYSISGVLKNALDWASTSVIINVLDGKIVAIMGAINGNFGTTRGQLHLRQVLHTANALPLGKPEVLVRRAQDHFDDTGRLTDDYARGKIRDLMAELGSASR